MKLPGNRLHGLFFIFALIWLSALLFYQDFGRLRYRPPVLGEAIAGTEADKIQVICDPVCFFVVDGKRVRSRIDSDAAAGLNLVNLRFYDAYHGLIGYEDDAPNPNFFVINTLGEFLQVIRLKLPLVNYQFEAYYPDRQLIRFVSNRGETRLYSANRPELLTL